MENRKKPMFKISVDTRNTARNIIILSRVSIADVTLILKAGIDANNMAIIRPNNFINDKFIALESIVSGTRIVQDKINIDSADISIENNFVFINNIPECKFEDLHFANSKHELKELLEGILLPDRYIEEKEFLEFKDSVLSLRKQRAD